MEDSLEFDYIFKYILVGDTSVGKSSLLASYVRNQFQGNNNPTMGVEFAIKKTEVNGSLVKLQVWDTAGQQSFRTITRAYYKNACGVILVYDLTCPKSIEGLESWVNEIEENSNEKAQIVIVGNKSDLEHSKEQIVLPPGISRFRRYITSAKTGNNVNKLFTELTASILAKISTGEIIPDGTHGVKKGNASKGSRNKKLSQYKNNEGEGSGSCC